MIFRCVERNASGLFEITKSRGIVKFRVIKLLFRVLFPFSYGLFSSFYRDENRVEEEGENSMIRQFMAVATLYFTPIARFRATFSMITKSISLLNQLDRLTISYCFDDIVSLKRYS